MAYTYQAQPHPQIGVRLKISEVNMHFQKCVYVSFFTDPGRLVLFIFVLNNTVDSFNQRAFARALAEVTQLEVVVYRVLPGSTRVEVFIRVFSSSIDIPLEDLCRRGFCVLSFFEQKEDEETSSSIMSMIAWVLLAIVAVVCLGVLGCCWCCRRSSMVEPESSRDTRPSCQVCACDVSIWDLEKITRLTKTHPCE